MTNDDIIKIIRRVVESDPLDNSQEKKLFTDAIIQQKEVLNRIPSTTQIEQAWQRWKRERFLDKNAEPNVDISQLYRGKK
jgi:hypothetical protein